ncbi:MAG: helix-turn-helix domain-containing protein [Thermodesulfobacteriota bacterium]
MDGPLDAPVTPERVLQLRLQHGISQEELGKWLGVSGTTIGRWESGQSSPRGLNLARFNQLSKRGSR